MKRNDNNFMNFIELKYDWETLNCIFKNDESLNMFLEELQIKLTKYIKKDIIKLIDLKSNKEKFLNKYKVLQKIVLDKVKYLNSDIKAKIIKKQMNDYFTFMNDDIFFILEVFKFDKELIKRLKHLIYEKINMSIEVILPEKVDL